MAKIKSASDLSAKLSSINGRGYEAYKSVGGQYRVDEFILFIDYVQGDPYASPSKLRVRLNAERAGFPRDLYRNRERRVGLEDYILRVFDQLVRKEVKGHRGSGKSGLVAVDAPGQEILERTAVVVNEQYVEVRLVAGLPARGRRILGRQAEEMLLGEIPRVARGGLHYRGLNPDDVLKLVLAKENACRLRASLTDMGAVAFIADGSILPRESGVSEKPMSAERAVPYRSPSPLRREVTLADGTDISGTLIPEGVTLIVGGGYHGKSTVLDALDRGIYDHIPGDGRELVVTVPRAVKIRAEDGRRVAGVDISPFISNLPNDMNTDRFYTSSASGSTWQAANIVEALEMGAEMLLVDEDTSATNFMVRDMRMQKLVANEKEPITPFIDRVRDLYEQKGISTVLVVGGSGDYFDVADMVIMMDSYLPRDVTERTRRIVREHPTGRSAESTGDFPDIQGRHPNPESIDPRRRGKVRVRARGLNTIQFGEENIQLDQVEQLVDPSQTRAVGQILACLERYLPGRTLREALDEVKRDLLGEGLDIISPFDGHPGDYARPRMMEVAAALNRLRSLTLMEEDVKLK